MSKISESNYYELVYDPITVHSSASATISFNGKSFTSDASGNTTKVIPWGTFTFSDSVSGQSYERTIDRNTTDLYVIPEGALYWYGYNNDFTSILIQSDFTKYGGSISFNTNDIKIICGESGAGALVQLNQNIDVSKYTKLYCVTNCSAISSVDGTGFTTSKIDTWTNDGFVSKLIAKMNFTGTGLATTVTDISSYGKTSANVYVQINTKGTGCIFACWFE